MEIKWKLLFRDYIGIMGYIGILYWDYGKENGIYYLGFRVLGGGL